MNVSNSPSALASSTVNQQPSPSASLSTNSTQESKQADAAKARQDEADKAKEAENRANETRVTLSQQATPQPNPANRNASPIEAYKAVSALHS